MATCLGHYALRKFREAHTAFQGDDVFRKNKGLVIESGIIGLAALGRLVGVESFNSLKANQFPTPWNPGRATLFISTICRILGPIGHKPRWVILPEARPAPPLPPTPQTYSKRGPLPGIKEQKRRRQDHQHQPQNGDHGQIQRPPPGYQPDHG